MNTSNIETTLRTLADKEAIRDLAHRYADCVWRKDVAGIVSLFSDDGEIDLQNGNVVIRGKAALRPEFEKMIVTCDRFPLVHSDIIELRGDTAVSTCYSEVRFASEGTNVTLVGYYHDQYVRADGQWKIRSRRFHVGFSRAD